MLFPDFREVQMQTKLLYFFAIQLMVVILITQNLSLQYQLQPLRQRQLVQPQPLRQRVQPLQRRPLQVQPQPLRQRQQVQPQPPLALPVQPQPLRQR